MSQEPPIFKIPSNDDHERVSALFLGPKAENEIFLRDCFDLIVSKQSEGRRAYFPNDPDFISSSLQASSAYSDKTKEIQEKLQTLLEHLNQWSTPFYSPRYSAHMCVDQSLPAILGYLSTMFYNPNNVAFEGSPYTTQIELLVGAQLCEMMGYNIDKTISPVAWGHIACDGTVANIESMWASRNLKFYPLSLRLAMRDETALKFIADSFTAETCTGDVKLLKDFTAWELLNLKVSTVVEFPERLSKQFHISFSFLDSAMNKYLVQTIGKDVLMKLWNIKSQPAIIVPSTKHYSWPKGAALTGIGSENAIDIAVDNNARMNIENLREYLEKCIASERAIYEVVAVIGTTEEGAVDRLDDIIRIRDELQKKGLSFVIHADAAWGGYFASMVPSFPDGVPRSDPSYVPHVGLRSETARQLQSLKDADCITIDPHKAGYVPYPAGGLCYKDGRMRYLVTWTAPYIDQGISGEKAGDNIGVYGVEGSKPGASAAAVYLAHQVIGTGIGGYGTLLGEASFTCRRFSSHWAAMSDDQSPYIVTPFNRLPSETDSETSSASVNDDKKFIRERILKVDNADLVKDTEAMIFLNQLGSDLNINAFACNFRYNDGTINEDIEEANWLNRQIFKRFSVTSPDEDPREIPFYLTSTVFSQNDYGDCATEFKRRLGLVGKQDLFVLRNVVMSPFSTTHNFVNQMADVFREELEEQVKNVRKRNEEEPGLHNFLVQGTDKLFLVHLPSFHMASGRRQIILNAEISSDDMKEYVKSRTENPDKFAMLRNTEPMLLDDIIDGKTFEASMVYMAESLSRYTKVSISNVNIVKKRSLDTEDFDSSYPELMPFYLYGTTAQMHIDHLLLLAPNIQLSAGNVKLTLSDGAELPKDELERGVIVVAKKLREHSMQPFPSLTSDSVPNDFFFAQGAQIDVTVYHDPYDASMLDSISMQVVTKSKVIGEGTVTVYGDVYVDSFRLNGQGELASRHSPMAQETKDSWAIAVDGLHSKLSN